MTKYLLFRYVFIKFLVTIFIISIVFFRSVELTRAMFVEYDFSWFTDLQEVGKFKKIFLVTAKRNKVLNHSDLDYIKEILYFFHKESFAAPPFHFIILENGRYYVTFKDVYKKANFVINNTSDMDSINILLIYEDNFVPGNFVIGLHNLFKDYLQSIIRTSNINSLSDILMYRCIGLKIRELNCYPDSSLGTLSSVFQNYVKVEKIPDQLDITFFSNMPISLNPGIEASITLNVKNKGAYGIFWSREYTFEGRFEKDSVFFVNEVWPSRRTWFILNSGGVRAGGDKVIQLSIKTPVMPGKYREGVNFFSGPYKVGFKYVEIEVLDIGHKVLRVRSNSWGFTNVYEIPDSKSNVVARVPSGDYYIFYDVRNGFYQINAQGRTGWVSENAIQVVKDH